MSNQSVEVVDGLRACHVNCQSLLAHIDEFRLFFEDSGYHIICLSETWLKPSISDEFVALSGYRIFRCDRIGKAGGGVAFYLADGLNTKILHRSKSPYCFEPEYLIAEILVSQFSKLLLSVVYRPPHCGHLADFFNLHIDLSTLYRHTIVFGDFNANLNVSTYDSDQVRAFSASTNMHIVPYASTYHTQTSASLLDLCFVDDKDKLLSFDQRDACFLSAHDLIEIKYDIRLVRYYERTSYARDMRSFDPGCFLRDLDSCDWGRVFEAIDIDDKVSVFGELLLDCVERNAPMRSYRRRRAPAPWLTSYIKSRMRGRDTARRRWKRCRTVINYLAYSELRNDVQRLVRDAKNVFFNNVFRDVAAAGEVWKRLRQLGLVKSRSCNSNLVVSSDGLNRFFVGSDTSDNCAISDDMDYGLREFDDTKLYWRHVGPDEVLRVLNRIGSCAIGADGLSSRFVHFSLPCTLPVLVHIFNYSLTYCIFPRIWKTAIVCPVPKIGCPSLCRDYRPISILSCISKALERIVADQIAEYLEERGLRDPFQSAYRRDFSSQTALVAVLDDVRRAVDDRMVTIMVSFDFSRAFDCVDHRLLLNKLKQLKFSGSVLCWLGDYLGGRTQAVRDPVSRVLSAELAVSAGVPQGSVLGPLLFSLYLLDFRNNITHCKYHFYADDLLVYLHCEPRNLAGGVAELNRDVERIVSWVSECHLALNPGKTSAMIAGSARFVGGINLDNVPKVVVDGVSIPYVDSIRYLGIIISNSLSWERQVTRTVNKIYCTLHQLKICRQLLPVSLRIRLVTALILPHLDYCCTAFTDLTGELGLRLQRAFNSSIRFIYRIRWDEHITPYFKRLGWLKVDVRREYFICCLLYFILHSGRPEYLYTCFTLRSCVASRNTRALQRDCSALSIPICRTEAFRGSFRCLAARLWNELPLEMRSVESIGRFKTCLYSYLLAPDA